MSHLRRSLPNLHGTDGEEEVFHSEAGIGLTKRSKQKQTWKEIENKEVEFWKCINTAKKILKKSDNLSEPKDWNQIIESAQECATELENYYLDLRSSMQVMPTDVYRSLCGTIEEHPKANS